MDRSRCFCWRDLQHLCQDRYCFRRGRSDVAICFAAVTCFLLAYAFTAKSIMQQTEDLWFLFVVFYLYAAARRSRAGVRAQRDESFNQSPKPARAAAAALHP